MTSFSDSITTPQFRANVSTRMGSGVAWIEYRGSSWSVGYPPGAGPDVERILARLQERQVGKRSMAASSDSLPSGCEDFVRELDRMGVVEERPDGEDVRVLSGKSACLELRAFIEEAKQRCCHARLYLAMEAGTVTRRQLIVYAKQYYFIVHAFPRVLGGALARAPAAAMDGLRRFFVAEAFHDSLLSQALAAVGESVEHELPLPSTLGLIASLSTYSRHDLPSFYAGLWIFETPTPSFMAAFERAARRLGLPEEFIEPMVRHGDINAAEAHDAIPDGLMSALPMVSEAALRNAKKNIVCLLEQLDQLEGALLEVA